jgi:hypothetical protein
MAVLLNRMLVLTKQGVCVCVYVCVCVCLFVFKWISIYIFVYARVCACRLGACLCVGVLILCWFGTALFACPQLYIVCSDNEMSVCV